MDKRIFMIDETFFWQTKHLSWWTKDFSDEPRIFLEKPKIFPIGPKVFSKKQNVPLVIAHYRRALPLFLEVKRLLDTQTIGDIQTVRIEMLKEDSGLLDPATNWRIDASWAGGGYFYDLAPHQLDLLFYFFGKAKSYKGKAFNKANLYKVEDTVIGEIELENGIHCEGYWCFCADKEKQKDIEEELLEKKETFYMKFGFKPIIFIPDYTPASFLSPKNIIQN